MRANTTKHKAQPPVDDTGPALLAQALESPEDDAPRLVYADWLEQQGHPLADVIRLQLAGSSATAVVNRHRKAWLDPIASWCTDEDVFERGMLRRLYGKAGAYAQKATQQALLGPSRTFGIADTMLRGPCKKLGAAATLAWTPKLFWWDCQLDDSRLVELVASPHLARLSSLTLEKIRATDTGLAALARSPSLSRLRHLALPAPVHLGKFTSCGVLDVLAHLPLTSLTVTGVNSLDLDAVVGSPNVSKLTRLSVDTRYVRAVAASAHLTALETLRITSIDHVEDADVAPLLDNPAFTNLSSVLLTLWSPTPGIRKPSLAMVTRLQARFGKGFTYDTSGTPSML